MNWVRLRRGFPVVFLFLCQQWWVASFKLYNPSGVYYRVVVCLDCLCRYAPLCECKIKYVSSFNTAHLNPLRGAATWLRHCTTSRKFAGSIPDGVTGIFHFYNPSSCTMDLMLTQALTEMSTRNISWGVKAADA